MIWSVICTLTFVFALKTGSRDYKTFFRNLLAPFWPIYEIAYLVALVLILGVFTAAAGAIGAVMWGLPEIIGAGALVALIALFATWGNEAVERVFKYVSILLYGTYAVFVVLVFTRFGADIAKNFSVPSAAPDWLAGGVTYASYNIIGAIVILPATRHLTSSRDAVTAGMLAGPLAMAPAFFFFTCMIAFTPAIAGQALPSDFMLAQLNLPLFRMLFQMMIFSALLESGVSGVHAINERIAQEYQQKRGQSLSGPMRLGVTLIIMICALVLGSVFGLVALIGQGYRWLAYTFVVIYVLPLLTLGIFKLLKRPRVGAGTG